MIKMRSVSIVLPIIAAVVLLLAACNAQTTLEAPQVTEPAEALNEAEDTATSSPVPLPSSTATIAYTPTATLPPPPTATSTLTALPTETESPTPTTTPNRLQTGLYPAHGCVTIRFPISRLYSVDFCVVRIEVDRNDYLLVTVSWTAHMPPEGWIKKGSDVDNQNMYLTDEFGNRYDHIGLSGAVGNVYQFTFDGETAFGSYIFPPIRSGGHIITFHDDDNNEEVGNLVLVNPTIIRQVSDLTWYPFAVEYLLEDWTGTISAEGGL